MKKVFSILALLFLIMNTSVFSQKLYVGAQTGIITSSSFSRTQNYDNSYPGYSYNYFTKTPSWSFGVNLEYRLTNKWSLASNLLLNKEELIQKYGHTSTFQYNFGTYYEWEEQTKYAYLRVPILAQYMILNSKKGLGLSIVAGPSLGFRTKSHFRLKPKNEAAYEFSSLIDATYAPRVKSLDLAFQLGLKVDKQLTAKSKLFLEVNCPQSLANIWVEDISLKNDNMINRRMGFNIGYQIGL